MLPKGLITFPKGGVFTQELLLPHSHGEINVAIFRELEKAERFGTVADIFKQLSDVTRLRIFWLLCHKEECVINIAALMGMSSPAVSHHLRAMYDSGLILSRRDGKEVYYKAADTEESRLLHLVVEQIMEIACPETDEESVGFGEALIHGVHTYLTEHLSERITIEMLSKRFLINPTTLKKEFKRIYGTSIAAHIKMHRMEKAGELLRKSNKSVAQIALTVGYESQSKFAEAFKAYCGMLPTEYRKQKM